MVIRRLTVKDAGSYMALRRRAVSEEPQAFLTSEREERRRGLGHILKRFRTVWKRRDDAVLGAFEDGDLIGMVGFFREAHEKRRHRMTIWGMYVSPEARGRGHGRALLREALKRCATLPGVEAIGLSVVTVNRDAMRLYSSVGFRRVGVDRRAWKLGRDYHDEESMVLGLSGRRRVWT